MLFGDRVKEFTRQTKLALTGACAIALLLAVPLPAGAASDACHDKAAVTVAGMACPFCAYGLRKHLLEVPGVTDVQVDLNKSEAAMNLGGGADVTPAQIQKAVRDAGFTPGEIRCEATPGSERPGS